MDAWYGQVWASITRALGSSVWQHTIIALSHGRMTTLPPDTSYGVHPCIPAGGLEEQDGGPHLEALWQDYADMCNVGFIISVQGSEHPDSTSCFLRA